MFRPALCAVNRNDLCEMVARPVVLAGRLKRICYGVMKRRLGLWRESATFNSGCKAIKIVKQSHFLPHLEIWGHFRKRSIELSQRKLLILYVHLGSHLCFSGPLPK